MHSSIHNSSIYLFAYLHIYIFELDISAQAKDHSSSNVMTTQSIIWCWIWHVYSILFDAMSSSVHGMRYFAPWLLHLQLPSFISYLRSKSSRRVVEFWWEKWERFGENRNDIAEGIFLPSNYIFSLEYYDFHFSSEHQLHVHLPVRKFTVAFSLYLLGVRFHHRDIIKIGFTLKCLL